MGRFFFDTDNDSHWFLVPLERKDEWDAWCSLDEDDENAWDAPEWARPLGGDPSRISFVDPLEMPR